MRIFKGLSLLLALALGANAQFIVKPVLVAVPSALPGFAGPALPAAAPSLTLSAAAIPSLTPALAAAPAPAVTAPAASAAANPRILLPGAVGTDVPSPANDDWGGLFDGAVRGADGDAVHPRLVASAEAPMHLPMRLGMTRGVVEKVLPALRDSVALGSWNGPHTTLDESCCGDAAPKLAAMLRARGIPVRLVEAEFHYYVILDMPDGQIVIDPTIRQFFGKKKAPRGIPDVFVGTIRELNQLFDHYRSAKTTRYDVSRIYFSEAKSREAQLEALESDIRKGGPRDLEPLRRALGLAAPSHPPAAARLIIP